jgi:hypothetical protein
MNVWIYVCMYLQAISAAIDHQRLQELESANKDEEIAFLKGHLAQIQVCITHVRAYRCGPKYPFRDVIVSTIMLQHLFHASDSIEW